MDTWRPPRRQRPGRRARPRIHRGGPRRSHAAVPHARLPRRRPQETPANGARSVNPSDHTSTSCHLVSAYAVDPETRTRAAQVVAANARDVADLRLLLNVLGL